MDVGKAFRFVFEDRDWVTKLLLGGLILLIPIFGIFALMGYMITVIRRVLSGDPNPLPDWRELGQKFVDGLLVWVAIFIYTLPALLLSCPVFAVSVLPMLGGENEDLTAVLTGVAGVLVIGLSCLIFLYTFLVAFLAPAIYLQYAGHGRLGACLRVGDIVRFTGRNLGSIFLILLLAVVISAVINVAIILINGALSVVVPCAGWVAGAVIGLITLPVAVWLTVFQGHLIGQIGRKSGLPSLQG
ncbi:MAG: DUF4013 domain-containing protein [Anaerolineae bacterium]|nr:DUF4013 domain-containing protein [Anaerolineae bacterium]MDW8068989.1 DUF4013 domain-containing protein [Anaerolineae bacterium]